MEGGEVVDLLFALGLVADAARGRRGVPVVVDDGDPEQELERLRRLRAQDQLHPARLVMDGDTLDVHVAGRFGDSMAVDLPAGLPSRAEALGDRVEPG